MICPILTHGSRCLDITESMLYNFDLMRGTMKTMLSVWNETILFVTFNSLNWCYSYFNMNFHFSNTCNNLPISLIHFFNLHFLLSGETEKRKNQQSLTWTCKDFHKSHVPRSQWQTSYLDGCTNSVKKFLEDNKI